MCGHLEVGEAFLTVNHDQGLFIGRQFRVGVVVTHERHALGTTATDAGLVDLRLATTVGGEIDGRAILAPERFGIDTRACGHASDLARTQVHHVDVRVAVLGQHERQAIAIRRECRCTVQAFEVGDLLAAAGVDVLHENAWTLLLEGDIGDTLAIGCETRRQDRLAGLQQRDRTCTVVVRALQRIAGVVCRKTLGSHVEHTGRKRPLDPGQLLERLVRNVVGHVTQLIDATRYATGQYLLLGGDIEQRVLYLQATACRYDAADHHVLGAQGLPVTEDHFAGLARQADHVLLGNRRVVTRVTQVVTDDFRHVFRQHAAPLPAKWHDGNRGGAVATTGDQNVLFLCTDHPCCKAENNQQSS
ncbi:hypothetical protein D9M71_410920 [compost metagenome]